MAVLGEPVVANGEWLTVIADSFRGGDPITPKQACCLRVAAGLAPNDAGAQWDEQAFGAAGPGDVWPLAELPEWVLHMVNPVWLHHFLQLFTDIGDRIDDGRVPYPRTMAERVALWIMLRQARKVGATLDGSLVYDTLDGLLTRKRTSGADLDWDRAQSKLFGGDFDFLRIWRDELNRIGFGVDDENANLAGPLLRCFHPYFWWDTRLGDDEDWPR